MKRIKSFVASALIALIVFAGFGFGIFALGLAIVLGGALALAVRLAGPGLMAEAEWRAQEVSADIAEAEPATA